MLDLEADTMMEIAVELALHDRGYEDGFFYDLRHEVMLAIARIPFA